MLVNTPRLNLKAQSSTLLQTRCCKVGRPGITRISRASIAEYPGHPCLTQKSDIQLLLASGRQSAGVL